MSTEPLPPEVEAPEVALAPPEPEVEPEIGVSLMGTDANKAIRALSRAARSFLLYDVQNEAIRQFLQEYRAAMATALQHGPLVLDVRPFELALHGEVVYLERDRERSLAFRLFRDGVRKLSLGEDVPWEELLRLLEILSIRFTGVRQSEDDVVTLLWKAGFKHIDITAVEGFVPEEEGEGTGDEEDGTARAETEASRRGANQIDAPPDWDLPGPLVGRAGFLGWAPIDPDELLALQEETSSRALAQDALTLTAELLRATADPAEVMRVDDVLHLIDEVRSFFLSEGQLDQTLAMVSLLEQHARRDERLATELARFSEPAALRRILGSMPPGATQAPPELLQLLDRLPGDHLSVLLDMMGEGHSQSKRAIERHLISHMLRERIDQVLPRIAVAPPTVALDLIRAIKAERRDQGVAILDHIVDRAEPELVEESLRLLGELGADELPRPLLLRVLAGPTEALRLQGIERVAATADRSLFPAVLERLDAEAPSIKECDALGRALARLDAARVWVTLRPVIRPQGLMAQLKGGLGAGRVRQLAAASAFGLLPQTDAEADLRWLAERASEEISSHCMRVLHRRRREGVKHG